MLIENVTVCSVHRSIRRIISLGSGAFSDFVGLASQVLTSVAQKLREEYMPMVCPRCATDVTAEAMYCPYCNLPKPKAGFALNVPTKPPTQAVSRKRRKPTDRRPHQPRVPGSKRKVMVLSSAALAAVLSVGIYIFVVPLVHSQGVEPRTALSALDKLQHMQSNQPELTIDGRMMAEVEKSRRVGNLVGYQGWTVHPIKGTTTRALLVFSYREVGNTEQRAEWLADLNANTFTPQTALAVAVHGK